jgi:3'-phosphoadenosine 5'-phosphosulfate sulfotransferase (PAPS reductase)/FAD synthetase
MLPVFSKYITFLKKNGLELDLKEGYYWYDNLIIKAYDKQGNIHKIVRIYIDDDLNITFKYYKLNDVEFESWQETVNRNNQRLKELELLSINLIESSINGYKEYTPIIFGSGGKDSEVMTHLVRKVAPNTLMLFNNTSLDCADTYKYIKTKDNLVIVNPKEGFYQWRERLNFIPTRLSRACCTIFKEGVTMNYLDKNQKYLIFLGMRNDESNKRASYQDEWKNEKWGNREWQGVLPIRHWSEEDIWLYILK